LFPARSIAARHRYCCTFIVCSTKRLFTSLLQ
jgi:hypothetical protein